MKNYIKRCVSVLFAICLAGAMALPAFAAKTPVELVIDGYQTREVLYYEYTIDQDVDIDGRFTGIPRGGKITVTVKATNDGNAQLQNWMTERNLPKDGQIILYENVSQKPVKTIEFKEAYCVEYEENWEVEVGHTETIVISCQSFKNGSAEYTNDWASVVSEGNTKIIIICAAVLAAAAVAAVIIVGKKRKSAKAK